MQGQLWNAGAVAIRPTSHKRGQSYVIAQCKEPGCTKPRRSAQGARYCEDHAVSIGYELQRTGGEPITRTCPCGRTFTARKNIRSATAEAWDEFCPDCHTKSPLTLKQLQGHNVPPQLVSEWLTLGADLACGVCGRKFGTHNLKVMIDHNHRCCEGSKSCGKCVRGLLCQSHNTAAGFVEGMMADDLLTTLVAWVNQPHG